MDAHPLTVHLPIALVLLWPLVDLVGLVTRRREVSHVGLGLLGLALVSSLVATVTGQAAFDAAIAVGHAPERLDEHASLANLVPWALLLALVARLGGAAKLGRRGSFLGVLVGFGLWPFIYQVGHTGGRLVFEQGVGVTGRAPVEASPARR